LKRYTRASGEAFLQVAHQFSVGQHPNHRGRLPKPTRHARLGARSRTWLWPWLSSSSRRTPYDTPTTTKRSSSGSASAMSFVTGTALNSSGPNASLPPSSPSALHATPPGAIFARELQVALIAREELERATGLGREASLTSDDRPD